MTSVILNDEAKEEIHGHILALQELAQIHHVPMFFAIAIENNEKETVYDKGILTAQSLGIELINDTIRKHLLVEAGYELVPPRENVTIVMEDLFDGK